MNWTFGYNLYSTYSIMFNASDYNKPEVSVALKSHEYQIYLITKRKKFFFDHCEQLRNHNRSFLYFLNDKHEKEWLEIVHAKHQHLEPSTIAGYTTLVTNGNPVPVRNFTVINNLYPYREMTGDNSAFGNKIETLWPSDLEVLYVGQSFGNMKTRIAKHEKIKEVALKVIDDSSNEEVIMICVKFTANDNVFGLVTPNSIPDVSPDGLRKLQLKAAKRISPQQQVTLYEASLIAYFKPHYNTEYKETFIGRGFSSYEQIYQTDFNFVSATLVMPEEFKTRIWSQHICQPAFTHTQHFPLETQTQKKSFFEFIQDQSK